MDSTTIEAMHEQVRVIYRAATGSAMDEADSLSLNEAAPITDEIEQRFAELEALARTLPQLTERIPPFSFTPLADVLEGPQDLLIEVAVPGVVRDDVRVDVQEVGLTVAGIRRGACGSNGRSFVRAQIPRGPFRVVLQLPCRVQPTARVEVGNGIVSIQLHKA